MTYFEAAQLLRSLTYGSIAIFLFLNARRTEGVQQGLRTLLSILFLSLSIGGLLRVFVSQTAMDYWVSTVNTPLGLGILFMELIAFFHGKSFFDRRKEDVLADSKAGLEAFSHATDTPPSDEKGKL